MTQEPKVTITEVANLSADGVTQAYNVSAAHDGAEWDTLLQQVSLDEAMAYARGFMTGQEPTDEQPASEAPGGGNLDGWEMHQLTKLLGYLNGDPQALAEAIKLATGAAEVVVVFG